MPPTTDTVWPFTDPGGRAALCHLRVWRRVGAPAVVVVGELADNPGGAIEASVARIAAALHHDVLLDGTGFRLVLHHPGSAAEPDGRFHEVHLGPGAVGDRRAARRGDAQASLRPIPRAIVERLVGEPVRVWDEAGYTSGAVLPRP